ncbi:MAG: hypothetical protein WBC44_22190 [Planctomycetaceae bacterium]
MNLDDAMGWLADCGAEIRLSRSSEGNARSMTIEIPHASMHRLVPDVAVNPGLGVSLFEGYLIDAVDELKVLDARS